jgi:hypothetical protein
VKNQQSAANTAAEVWQHPSTATAMALAAVFAKATTEEASNRDGADDDRDIAPLRAAHDHPGLCQLSIGEEI